MLVVSSITINPPDPSIVPVANPPSANDSYDINRGSPAAVFKNKSAGRIGTEEPPATTAFNFFPPFIPPQYSSLYKNSSTGKPISIS